MTIVLRLVLPVLFLGLGFPTAAMAQATRPVSTESDLRAALAEGQPGDTIVLQSDITLTSDLPEIRRTLTLDGGGFTLSGAGEYRGLVTQTLDYFDTVAVTLRNLTIADTLARGGTNDSGYGEAGLGGALYIGSDTFVTVDNVAIRSSHAIGSSGTLPGAGGGAGLGGGVFIDGSGMLRVETRFDLDGNRVAGGAGNAGGPDGQALGSGIFLTGSGQLDMTMAEGITSTIADDIVDMTGAGVPDGGSWRLQKCGGGTLILTGDNRYAGGTTVCGGTLQVASERSLGSGEVALANGTLSITGNASVANDLIVGTNSTVRVAAGRTVAWHGTIDDYAEEGDSLIGTLRLEGGGVLDLTNTANDYQGGTVVVGGSTVRVSQDSALGRQIGQLTLGDGTGTGTLAIAAGSGFSSTRTIVLGAAGGAFDTETGATAVLNGVVMGPGGLTKRGAGTLVLANAATRYAGPTDVAQGTLRTGAANLFTPTAALRVGDAGIVDLDGFSQAVGSLTGNGAITLGTATLTIGSGGTTSAFGGRISGNGQVVKIGDGTLTLTGTNTYTGGTLVAGGILRGTTSGLQGAIVNDATVVFDQAASGTYAGAMSGTGTLVKEGNGRLTLAGANSYTGGTTVTAGVLAGTTASLQGAITNNATVVFEQHTDGTYAGTMSGTGALVKEGNGRLTLTGAHTYAGGTTVTGGTLAGTTASLQGAIANDALVVFDQAFDGTFGGTMTGSGVVQKTGLGTLSLAGALAHTGGTVVSGGQLAGTATTLRGTIVNDATVTFGGSASGTFEGQLAGSGTFNKIGAGTLRLTGTHAHDGLFNVGAGVLELDGLLASRIAVAPGATLRAVGTILGTTTVGGALVVPSPTAAATVARSIAAAGDDAGRLPLLTFGGDLFLTPGSHLSLPVTFGDVPTVFVAGSANISGAIVDVTPVAPLTERTTSFLALSAANGLQITGATGASSNPLYVPVLNPGRNALVVTILNLGIPLGGDVTSPSARSVGDVLDRFKDDPTDDQQTVIRELTGLSDGDLDRALRQISGEAHASFVQIGVRDAEANNDLIRQHISSRRRDVRPGADLGASWWGQMGGEHTRLKNAAGDQVGAIDLGSGTGGMDYHPSDRWTFGLGAGLSGGGINITDLISSGDILSPRAFGYAGWRPGDFGGFTGGATFARQDMDTTRRIVFQGRLPDELGGDPIGEGIDREAQAEEVTLVKDQWTDWDDEHEFGTYSLSYVLGYRRATFTRRGFIESGADSLSLAMPEQTLKLRQANALVNVWRREGDFQPFGEFLYRREFTDGRTTTQLEFPDAGDSRFSVEGLPAPQNVVRLQLGATWYTKSRIWKFEYHYRNATGQTTHGGSLHVSF